MSTKWMALQFGHYCAFMVWLQIDGFKQSFFFIIQWFFINLAWSVALHVFSPVACCQVCHLSLTWTIGTTQAVLSKLPGWTCLPGKVGSWRANFKSETVKNKKFYVKLRHFELIDPVRGMLQLPLVALSDSLGPQDGAGATMLQNWICMTCHPCLPTYHTQTKTPTNQILIHPCYLTLSPFLHILSWECLPLPGF